MANARKPGASLAAAGYFCIDAVLIDRDLLNSIFTGVAAASRKAVGMVDIVQEVEPLLTPPGFAEGLGHEVRLSVSNVLFKRNKK